MFNSARNRDLLPQIFLFLLRPILLGDYFDCNDLLGKPVHAPNHLGEMAFSYIHDFFVFVVKCEVARWYLKCIYPFIYNLGGIVMQYL